MKLHFLKYFLITTLTVVLFSCSDDASSKSNKAETFISWDEGLIRGVNLNDTKQKVKSIEQKESLTKETEELLEYKYVIDKETTYELAYSFDENGCFEIDVDASILGENKAFVAKGIITFYKSELTKKFGEAKQEDAMLIWHNQDQSIAVELDYLNESSGEIILTLYANE